MKTHFIEFLETELSVDTVIDDNNRLVASDSVPQVVVIISRQLRIIRAACTVFEYRANVYYHDRDVTELTIDGKTFAGLDVAWLISTFGAKLIGSDGSLILSILKKSARFANEDTLYDLIGWGNVDEELFFVADGFRVDSHGIRPVHMVKGCSVQQPITPADTACSFVRNVYLPVFRDLNIGRIFLCYLLLGNLQVPVRQHGNYINFLLYIHGESG